MNMNQAVLRAAIATALGFTSPYVVATADDFFQIGGPVKLSLEAKLDEGHDLVFVGNSGFKVDINAAAGRTISDTSPMEVRFTLTNGAKFKAVDMSNFGCDFKNPVAGQSAAVSMLNGPGETTVTFKLKDGSTIADSSPICTLSAVSLQLYGGQKAYTMMVTGYLKSNAEPVVINTSGPIVDFTQAYGVSVDSRTVTVDVTNPALSQKFIKDTTIADIGVVGYTAMAAGKVYKAGNVTAIGKTDILTTLKVTLSGTPLSVTNGQVIAVSAGAATNYAMECTANADLASKNPKTMTAVADGVTFEIGAATAGTGVRFCLQTSGTTRIEKGKITIQLTAVEKNSSTPNVSITNPTMTTVVKNGASIKILNIPNPTNTDKAFVRIYNMSSGKSSVYGTLYEASADGKTVGKELGKGKLLAEIDAGAVKALDAAAIASIFGISTWTGRAWMQIEGDTQQIRAQSLVRSGGVGGSLINLSDRILEDSGKLCRSDTQCK
jgi:hypothetical protein